MKWVSVTVMVFLLGSFLIIGCGGGGSTFTLPGEDSGIEDGIGEVHSIAFISATPQTIAIKGTGGYETSVVVFKAVDENDNPVPNKTVNFELSTEAGGLSLSKQSDVSTSKGLVKVTVNAGNVSTSLRVTATLDSNPSITVVSDELFVDDLFAGEASSIAFISATPQTIALKGTGGHETSLVVFKVVDVYGDPVSDQTINFELSTEAGGLSLSKKSAESDPNGLVRATVNAGIVSTPVSVTAILDSNPSIKVVSVELFVGEAISIAFISASPQTIALEGTGGPPRFETSVLYFKVVDGNGNPIPNQTVSFELSTEVGGLSLSNESAESDSEGLVRVTVKAGNMPTHIRVHAFLANDPSIRVVSDELTVTTGLPDADSISMSAEIYNSESWDYDNVQVPILFQAADIFNNFVPDGTRVSFTTEGGSIIGSSVIEDGVCEVIWRSGNPRPPDGLFTILAFCIGEESFTDLNSNGLYDPNDLLTRDLAEPFRDDNQNGIHDDGEWYWDYNTNGEFDDEPNGIYNGTLCSDDAEASGECTKELVYVHAWVDLIMSGSFAVINFYPDPVDLTGGNTQTVLITISDVNNNPMPYKTEVKLTLTNGKFVDDSKSMEFKIGNTNLPGPTLHTVTILPTEDAVTSGKLVVKVTTPFENETIDFTDVIDDYYETNNN